MHLDKFSSEYLHRRIESIRLTREIGRGVRSVVFAGFQESLARNVAVKIFPNTMSPGEVTDIPARREAVMLSTLDHPNIIRLLGYGELDDCCYIVMPLFEGGSLRTLIRQGGGSQKTMSVSACLDLMLPILDALSYVHDRGMVHRDLKPSNILIDARRTPCLADLGCAGAAGSPGYAGTALYMSPEQAAGKILNPRSDIYSIGVILFEMAAGELPIGPRSSLEIIQCKRIAPETFFAETPRNVSSLIGEPLERIILKAIAPEPGDRYADCRALATDLAALRPDGAQ